MDVTLVRMVSNNKGSRIVVRMVDEEDEDEKKSYAGPIQEFYVALEAVQEYIPAMTGGFVIANGVVCLGLQTKYGDDGAVSRLDLEVDAEKWNFTGPWVPESALPTVVVSALETLREEGAKYANGIRAQRELFVSDETTE